MAGVINGQAVDAPVTNAAFIARNGDSDTLAKLTLNDQDVSLVSGTQILNTQREFNAIWNFLGGVVNQVKTYLPTWGSNRYGATTDKIQTRIEQIDQYSATLIDAQTISKRNAIRYSIVFGK